MRTPLEGERMPGFCELVKQMYDEESDAGAGYGKLIEEVEKHRASFTPDELKIKGWVFKSIIDNLKAAQAQERLHHDLLLLPLQTVCNREWSGH